MRTPDPTAMPRARKFRKLIFPVRGKIWSSNENLQHGAMPVMIIAVI